MNIGATMVDFLADKEFEDFKTVIYNESGITFSSSNRSILESRLKEKLREKSLATPSEYYRLITTNKEEMKNLLDSVTTNLTRFFRNQPHFDALQNYVIPELIKLKKDTGRKRISIWSAGCSTGEEPYTIAMVLSKHLPPGFTGEVLASDLSLKCLMTAQSGFYTEQKVQGIPEVYLNAYFDKVPDGYQVKKTIMSMVKFDYHNLKHESKRTDFDVIFCRNVLIYFDEKAQKEVVDRFYRALNPQGFLFIGHSESLFGMETQFQFLKTQWACFYKKG